MCCNVSKANTTSITKEYIINKTIEGQFLNKIMYTPNRRKVEENDYKNHGTNGRQMVK